MMMMMELAVFAAVVRITVGTYAHVTRTHRIGATAAWHHIGERFALHRQTQTIRQSARIRYARIGLTWIAKKTRCALTLGHIRARNYCANGAYTARVTLAWICFYSLTNKQKEKKKKSNIFLSIIVRIFPFLNTTDRVAGFLGHKFNELLSCRFF